MANKIPNAKATHANATKTVNPKATSAPAAVTIEPEAIPRARPLAEFRLTMPGGKVAVGRCELKDEPETDDDDLEGEDDE